MIATRPRRAPRALVTRSFVAAALVLIGTTCRDAPTEPTLNPSVANAGGLSITPALDTLLVTEQVTLTARNMNGTPINKQAVWTSSDTNIATVVSTGFSTGRVTGRAPGSVTIQATSGNKDGTATIVVRPIPVHSVSVTPDSASLQLGDSTQYTAVPRDSAGNPLAGRVVTWSVGDTLIARVSASGMALAVARGTTPVIATVEGVVGSKPLIVRVPQLDVPALATVDSANAGDTLVIAYSARNAQDAPDADSVIVRVGIRNTSTGAVYAAVRRALPRIAAGATTNDTARIQIGLEVPAGPLDVVAYADCRDSTSATNELRLTSCLGAPASAGVIPEGSETDNSRSASVVVRGPELAATALAAPDSIFTRTSVSATLTIANAGSATGAGFDVVAGLYDVTAGAVVAASATTTLVLASRVSRDVQLSIVIPALLDVAHTYQVRAFADCKSTGTPAERLAACFTNPATAGEIAEAVETNNSATRAAVVASNIARVDALPDSSLIVALQDTTVLVASAFDRANALVEGVTFAWTSLDPTIATSNGQVITAQTTGVARIVVSAEGRVDTARVYVVQQAARLVASHDSVTLGSLGETRQVTAAVRDRNANPIPGTQVTWLSLDTTVATVSETGLVTAVALGTTHVVATHGVYADSVKVTVTQLPARVVASPDSTLFQTAWRTAPLSAVVYDNNGYVVAGAAVTWSSLHTDVATVEASSGVVTASLMDGVASIVATAQGGYKDTVRVYVSRVVAMMFMNPDSVTATAMHMKLDFTAAAGDSAQEAVLGAPVTFAVLDTAIIRLDSVAPPPPQSGFGPRAWVTVISSSGTGRIVASHGAFADTSHVTVAPNAVTLTVSTSGTPLTAIGDTAIITVRAFDSNSNEIPNPQLVWTHTNNTSPPATEMISPGVFVARADGYSTIKIESGLATVETALSVQHTAVSIVAQPDTLRLNYLGAQGFLTATSYDRRGNPVPNAPPNFGVADTSVITLNGNVVTAVGVGIAHVLVNPLTGAGLDTVVVIVQQVAASIELDRASAVTTVDGTFTVNAALRDQNDNPISGRIITWVSLNTGIATVNGTTVGQVIGVAEGATAIIGSVDGVADTMPVAVNPEGFTHRWLGTTSSAWTNAANWAPGVPDSTSNVYVPAGTPHQPDIDAQQVYTYAIKVDAGVNITRPTQSNSIEAFGSVDNAGAIAALRLRGAGGTTVRGNFTELGVATNASLSGRTTAAMGVGIGATDGPLYGSSLDVNGHTLVTGTLNSFYGKLIQDAANDSVIVTGAVNWGQTLQYNLRSQLTAGVLTVGGDLMVWYADTAFVSSGTHKIVFTGAGSHQLWQPDTLAGFNDVEVNGTVTTLTTMGVKGRLVMNAGSVLRSDDSNAYLTMHSSLPEGSGSVQLLFVKLVGTANMAANSTINGGLSIESGGHLKLNGRKVDVRFLQTLQGTVTMNGAPDTLIVREHAGMYGASQLSAGTLILQGGLLTGNTGYPGFEWNVSGSHKTVFNGAAEQTPSFGDTSYVALQNVEVTNTVGVTIGSPITIGGQLKLLGGGRVSANSNGQLMYKTQLPDVSQGVYDVSVTIVTGTVNAARNESFSGGLFVDRGGYLRVAGRKLQAATGLGVLNGTLTMDNVADTIVAGTYSQFYGVANLSAGTMIVNGDLNVSNYMPGASWNLSGTHKTVFAGTVPQAVSFSDTVVANLHHVDVRNAQGVTVANTTNVRGLLRLVDGGKLSGGMSGFLKYWTQLPDVAGGVYDVNVTVVSGNITATRNETFTGSLFVDGGGHLRLGGHTIDVFSLGTQNGTITMDHAADTLVSRNYASFYGVANFSAGTYLVKGDLQVSNYMPGAAWNLTGTHKTVFAGTVPQTLTFQDSTGANLRHVDVSNTQGLTLSTNATVHGQLRLVAGGKFSTSQSAILKVSSLLPDVGTGVYDVNITAVVGNVTATQNEIFNNSLFVMTGGNLTLGGRTIDARYFGTQDGTLTMNNAADHLIIRDFAQFYGAANLTAGTLTIRGDLYISNMGSQPSAFAGSGAHTTVFGGTAAQNLTMPADGFSHFGNFKVDNAAGLLVNADSLDVRGALMGAGAGVLKSNNGLRVKIAGGLAVAGLVLDKVALDVSGALTQFDNVTFQNWVAPALLRMRNAGDGSTFTMNNVAFLQANPGGGFYWVDAEDTDAGTGAFTLDIVGPQAADGPAATRVTNGAVVGWRLPTP